MSARRETLSRLAEDLFFSDHASVIADGKLSAMIERRFTMIYEDWLNPLSSHRYTLAFRFAIAARSRFRHLIYQHSPDRSAVLSQVWPA